MPLSRRQLFQSLTAAPLIPALAPPGLDPKGRIHIPIGIPDTLDTLKTFVEAEGNFSPGVGSYGIYFWIYLPGKARLYAPTMDDVAAEHGLAGGLLIPYTRWDAGGIRVTTSVREVARQTGQGEGFVVGARVSASHDTASEQRVRLYIALRPLGPAGSDVKSLTVDEPASALLVDGRAAVVPSGTPGAAGVSPRDDIGEFALRGELPAARQAASDAGDCSGAICFDRSLAPRSEFTVELVCPVLPGRRAARHKWVDLGQNALADMAELNPAAGGLLQPDPGLAYYRDLQPAGLFADSRSFWQGFTGRAGLHVPDRRWRGAFGAILAHAALCMNEGAPDAAVVNYNVFNRDGVYVAHMMQKSGNFDLAERAIDYFLEHPFNGRAYPEADNPGQILWILGEHWRFTRNEPWLRRVYPAAAKIARMIEYYRTTPGPHWVAMDRLEFGDALSPDLRLELEPGRCDGFHPEYTKAFDIAGLRAVNEFAAIVGREPVDPILADRLFDAYDARFRDRLAEKYGSYCVLWPCQLYPLDRGPAHQAFRSTGARSPKSWRYFPLATAHQGLLAGNREAGYGTLNIHLDHEQMRGWYAFDEGGGSGSGGWHRTRTTWTHSKETPGDNKSVAMPHGWAIAELWLLMRDSLVFEQDNKLVLLAGIDPAWLRSPEGFAIDTLPTWFGAIRLSWKKHAAGATVTLDGTANPPGGFTLRLPATLGAKVFTGGGEAVPLRPGDYAIPRGSRQVRVVFPA